jgi:hypothetical protein
MKSRRALSSSLPFMDWWVIDELPNIWDVLYRYVISKHDLSWYPGFWGDAQRHKAMEFWHDSLFISGMRMSIAGVGSYGRYVQPELVNRFAQKCWGVLKTALWCDWDSKRAPFLWRAPRARRSQSNLSKKCKSRKLFPITNHSFNGACPTLPGGHIILGLGIFTQSVWRKRVPGLKT